MKTRLVLTLALMLLHLTCWAKDNVCELRSPNGKIVVRIDTEGQVRYSLWYAEEAIVRNAAIGMEVEGHGMLGCGSKAGRVTRRSVNTQIASPLYKKAMVTDCYNEAEISFRGGYSVTFRAYDEGVAYRFNTQWGKQPVRVMQETMELPFTEGMTATVAYTNSTGTMEQQLANTFENNYVTATLPELETERLILLPAYLRTKGGKHVCVTESDLEDYPGTYLYSPGREAKKLVGYQATYPRKVKQTGFLNLELQVEEREPYIALTQGTRHYPWRILCLAENEADMMQNDMVYRLASPSRINDLTWIEPGQAIWDWWSGISLFGVPFKAGINTETYKYYIDFAARYGVPYVLIDEGWNVRDAADLMQVVPEVDLSQLVAYGKEKGVGLLLWAGYYAVEAKMEEAFRHYAAMGIRGFKIDYMNRDDQLSVDFHRRAAEMAARYHLVLDFHGTYKPAGITRTYPNVLNVEGVAGMEFNKWSTVETYRQLDNDVVLPLIRMVAGPMDYTQGAMLNADRAKFHAVHGSPMSQGTRCHQMADYVVFLSPLNMLSDSPSRYYAEAECTQFITQIPTVWDELRPLTTQFGEWVAVARRKGNTWWVGALTNWTERDLTLDLSFLPAEVREIEIFEDGVNANQVASDYVHRTIALPADRQLRVHLASGGGVVLRCK